MSRRVRPSGAVADGAVADGAVADGAAADGAAADGATPGVLPQNVTARLLLDENPPIRSGISRPAASMAITASTSGAKPCRGGAARNRALRNGANYT